MTLINNNSSNLTLNYGTDDYQWLEIGVHVAGAITFFVGFPTNFIIIYLVSRRKSLRIPTNFFVCSLAVADLLVLLCMLLWITNIHVFPNSPIMRKYVYPSLDMFLGVSAMINVACVSTDRAIAVAFPLKYETIVTSKRTFAAILFCWSYSFLLLVLALVRINAINVIYNKIILCLGFVSLFVPVSIVVGSYAFILFVIVNKLKGMRELERVIFIKRILNDQELSEKRRRRRRKLLRELKVTGNVLLIVIPFTTGWTFFVGTHLHEAIRRKPVENFAHHFAIAITPWILSGLNPILYLLLNRSLRLSFISTFKKLFKSQSYYLDDTKTSFFSTLSRRASNPFRRPSNALGDETNGFLSVSRLFTRRRDSKMSGISIQSKESDIIPRDTEMHLAQCNENDESSLQSASCV